MLLLSRVNISHPKLSGKQHWNTNQVETHLNVTESMFARNVLECFFWEFGLYYSQLKVRKCRWPALQPTSRGQSMCCDLCQDHRLRLTFCQQFVARLHNKGPKDFSGRYYRAWLPSWFFPSPNAADYVSSLPLCGNRCIEISEHWLCFRFQKCAPSSQVHKSERNSHVQSSQTQLAKNTSDQVAKPSSESTSRQFDSSPPQNSKQRVICECGVRSAAVIITDRSACSRRSSKYVNLSTLNRRTLNKQRQQHSCLPRAARLRWTGLTKDSL